jgi:integrase
VTLSAFVERWYEMHGKTLTSGDERKVKLLAICERLGDPLASHFDKNTFAVYREKRLAGEWNQKGKKKLSEATVNREQSYLHAIFSEMKRLGDGREITRCQASGNSRRDQELAFLYEEEIERLLTACDQSANKDLGVIVRICLATGARWSEAQDLKQSQVLPGRLTFTQTKSKKNRTVPISQQLQKLLPKSVGRFSRQHTKPSNQRLQEPISSCQKVSAPMCYAILCEPLHDAWREYFSASANTRT